MTERLKPLFSMGTRYRVPRFAPVTWLARRLPPVYLLLLTLLALGGYALLLGFPVAAIALAATVYRGIGSVANLGDVLLVVLNLSLMFLATAITVALARVRPLTPQERLLGADEAPALFEEMDELAELVHGRIPEAVHLRAGSGVELVRVARNGFPLRWNNHLMLGLLSLQSLSADHLRPLVARRIMRTSWRHVGLSGWLHDLVYIWDGYARTYALYPSAAHTLLLSFFAWYAPLYRRFARHNVRRAEVALDRDALHIINDNDMAQSLTMNTLVDRFLERQFWPHLKSLARQHEKPPANPFGRIEEVVDLMLRSPDAERWLRRSFPGESDDGTFTPPLGQRLHAIGYNRPPELHRPERFASQVYLGAQREQVVGEIGQAWRETNRKSWQKVNQRHHADESELEKLSAADQAKPLSGRKLERYIELVEKQQGLARALPLYKRRLEDKPEDASLRFTLGQKVLKINEQAGRLLLEQAMALDEGLSQRVVRLLSTHQTMKRAKGLAGA